MRHFIISCLDSKNDTTVFYDLYIITRAEHERGGEWLQLDEP